VLALPLLLLIGLPVGPGHAQPTSITDTTVDDIYANMDALGRLAPGDTAPVVVERGDTTLTREVQF